MSRLEMIEQLAKQGVKLHPCNVQEEKPNDENDIYYLSTQELENLIEKDTKTGIYIFEREKDGTTKSLLKVVTSNEEQVKEYCKFFAGYQAINQAARIRIISNNQEMDISEFLHY